MKSFLKFLASLLSLILSIALFVIITASVTLFSIKQSLGESSIKRAVSKIDFSSLIDLSGGAGNDIKEIDIQNGVYTARQLSAKSVSDDDVGFKISQSVLDRLSQYGIDEEMMEEYLSSDLINSMAGELFARYSAGFAEYMLNGDTDTFVDAEFLHSLFEDNLDDIVDYFDISLSGAEKNELLAVFDDLADDIEDELPGYDELEETVFEDSDIDFDDIRDNILKPVFSNASTVAAVAAIIGIFALLVLLRRSWYRWMIWAGIPMLFSGLFILVGSLIVRGILKAVVSEEELGKTGLSEIFKPLTGSFIMFSILALLISVAFIVLYSVFSAGERRAEIKRRLQSGAVWQNGPLPYGMPPQYPIPPQAYAPQQYGAPTASQTFWQPTQDQPQQTQENPDDKQSSDNTGQPDQTESK